MLTPTLDASPPLHSGQRGRPRRRPGKLHADRAYDAWASHECKARGMVPRIARKDTESSERLGRRRWVVEQTHSWSNRFCGLPIRYKRRADIYEALPALPQASSPAPNQTVLLGALKKFAIASAKLAIS